jgi:hypothetical protein
MSPISQVELTAHFRDLEQQVTAARRSQGAAFGFLRTIWCQFRSKRRSDVQTSISQRLAPAKERARTPLLLDPPTPVWLTQDN